ncbi:MAG: DUF952 domain-containing protein [Rhodanobacteraceae bacterium]|nr:DUF952 domain-containing protein [Rhodanobacteraceae bacterium]MBK7042754.1 DUF952 domain-containing protein [Rhodanobacteraceae bacterium]MBP9155276.1 DUF952 domain-containing protein [Xanthomonadales bacterium]HQW81113.1 DUF952 domain-containing protein [Pseudomonadota bacterium]
MSERPSILFHFAARRDWADAQAVDEYRSPSLATEGFIHCATRTQIPGVIQRHLQGRTDLVRLTLDATRLEPWLRYEWSETSGDDYPHVHGPIPMNAVISVELFDPTEAEYGG